MGRYFKSSDALKVVAVLCIFLQRCYCGKRLRFPSFFVCFAFTWYLGDQGYFQKPRGSTMHVVARKGHYNVHSSLMIDKLRENHLFGPADGHFLVCPAKKLKFLVCETVKRFFPFSRFY